MGEGKGNKSWGQLYGLPRPQRAGPREFPYESEYIYNQLLNNQCVSDASKYEIAGLGDAAMGKRGSVYNTDSPLIAHVILAASVTRMRLNQSGLLDA